MLIVLLKFISFPLLVLLILELANEEVALVFPTVVPGLFPTVVFAPTALVPLTLDVVLFLLTLLAVLLAVVDPVVSGFDIGFVLFTPTLLASVPDTGLDTGFDDPVEILLSVLDKSSFGVPVLLLEPTLLVGNFFSTLGVVVTELFAVYAFDSVPTFELVPGFGFTPVVGFVTGFIEFY